MSITIKDDLRVYIDPLTEDEYAALERSLLAEGCRDALVLWGDVLVDGHNRYAICQKHGIEFKTVQNTRFKSMDDVHLWMIDNHLGRRSVSDFQRGVLALRKKAIVAAKAQGLALARDPANPVTADTPPASNDLVHDRATPPAPDPSTTREALAKAARVSSNTLGQIEKIQREAAPELVQAVRAGTISINAAAAVATLPHERQVAAAAGGKKELRQAAREVRETRASARVKPQTPDEPAAESSPTDDADVAHLRQRVEQLTAALAHARQEAEALRQQVMSLRAALAAAGVDAYHGGQAQA